MVLINQDGDKCYQYNGEALYSLPVLGLCGVIYGFNLYLEGDHLLGSFDSLEEVRDEMLTIRMYEWTEYQVSGSAGDFQEYVDQIESGEYA